jgi:hypothetical protein
MTDQPYPRRAGLATVARPGLKTIGGPNSPSAAVLAGGVGTFAVILLSRLSEINRRVGMARYRDAKCHPCATCRSISASLGRKRTPPGPSKSNPQIQLPYCPHSPARSSASILMSCGPSASSRRRYTHGRSPRLKDCRACRAHDQTSGFAARASVTSKRTSTVSPMPATGHRGGGWDCGRLYGTGEPRRQVQPGERPIRQTRLAAPAIWADTAQANPITTARAL